MTSMWSCSELQQAVHHDQPDPRVVGTSIIALNQVCCFSYVYREYWGIIHSVLMHAIQWTLLFYLCDLKYRWLYNQLYRPLSLLQKSHNTPVAYPAMQHFKCTHACTFLFQNGALWGICLMHCGICDMFVQPFPLRIHTFKQLLPVRR